MAKTSSLVTLIHSLSKGEKRYFKLCSSLQKGAKDYLFLFSLLEKGGDADAIRKMFAQGKPAASYEATCKYLFKVMMDCLLKLHTDRRKSAVLMEGLQKADILFEKSMYEEGFKELAKIQIAAEEFEQYLIQLWAAKAELYYLSNLNFLQVSEAQLIKKQMKIDELIKYSKTLHQHTSLYELLRHRFLYKGGVRTKQQKEQLNDLVVTELNLMSKPFAENFESKKMHLLFQAHYFISTSNYESAIKTFYELNELFTEHRFLWMESPFDYLSAMEGILDSLHTIRRYDEMHFFLEKLKHLQNHSVYFSVMIQRVVFIYKLVGLLDAGDFESAIALKEQFELSLFKKIHLLDLNKQAEVYLYTALIYLGAGNISKAHLYVNKILLESQLFYSLPVYRTFRLLHLLVHFELGNHEYIEYETRSIKRGLVSSESESYLLEKIVFTFVIQASKAKDAQAKAALWKKIKKDFEAIQYNKYEIQILKIFDFGCWIEASLCKQSFAALLKAKNKPVHSSR